MPRFLVLSVIAVTTVVCGWHARAADEPKPDAKERFDLLVRDDLFAGFNGDAAALVKGMKACDAALAKNPKHAEALVWHGAARVYQAGQLFQAKKPAEGFKSYTVGLKDMDDAVSWSRPTPGCASPARRC